MDIKLDKTKLRNLDNSEAVLEELLPRIGSGKAILFTGAGFSSGSKNVLKSPPPNANTLALSICELGEFEPDTDLRFAADYYLENKDKNKLIKFLKETFTLTEVAPSQINICKANWRRYYTTNYDQSIEIASARSEKLVERIDLEMPPQEHYKKNGICIHLNGSIDSLDENSIETGFKLSTSSYINPDSFINSDWYYPFKQDLERCSAIVFIGYSLYDIEIQKVLFENSALAEKTYFVTQENPNSKTKFTMEKFGHILPIGADKFSKLLVSYVNSNKYSCDETLLETLEKFEVSTEKESTRDRDIESMLMHGNISQDNIDNAVLGSQIIPYVIVREMLPQIIELVKDSSNIVIFGELGNGKSLMMNELLPALSVEPCDVYTLIEKSGDSISDLEKISASGRKSIVMIDDYESQLDLLKHFVVLAPNNITLALSARTSDHERLRPILGEMGFEFNEFNVDFLSPMESEQLVKILNHVGMWGEKSHLSHVRKMKYLERDNQMQISLALLTIFESPQMLKRIKEIISDEFDDLEFKNTVFAIALLETINAPANSSLISEVATNNNIYSSSFRDNKTFKQLFKISGNSIISKSSLFCQSLIKNNFDASYVTGRLQVIAKNYAAKKSKDFFEEQIFKATLKFSFVERLLPTANKKSNLYKYYEDLKTSVPWLKNDPHYWVQYAMTRIQYKDYSKAQGYFDTAYGLAKNKYRYHTSNIDTQQGRLYLLVAINSSNPSDVNEYFRLAHRTFSSLNDDVYKFRQLEKYRDFYEIQFKNLSRSNRAYFLTCCQQILNSISKAERDGGLNLSHQKAVSKTQDHLEQILSKEPH